MLAIFNDVLDQPGVPPGQAGSGQDADAQRDLAPQRRCRTASPSASSASIVYGRENALRLERRVRDHRTHPARRFDGVLPAAITFPPTSCWRSTAISRRPEMKDKLEKLVRRLDLQQPAVPPFPPVTARPRPGDLSRRKDDVTQTFFSTRTPGRRILRDKDYPALEVMGGHPRRRISQPLVPAGPHQAWATPTASSAGWGADYDHPGLFQISRQHQVAIHDRRNLQAIGRDRENPRRPK